MKKLITSAVLGFVVLLLIPVTQACNYGEGSYGSGGYQSGCGSGPTPTTAIITGAPINKTPVYRFWSQELKVHFYTANEEEKNYIIANYPDSVWKFEGTNFNTADDTTQGAVPLYRFWSQRYSTHFYTNNPTERDYIIANYPTEIWNYEGEAMKILRLDDPRNTAIVYRFYNPSRVTHFYTANEDEKNRYVKELGNTWNFENGAFKSAK